MMPVNVPFMPGNVGGAHPQLIKGCWVIGFYLDNDKQKPIIMGSIGQTPGATNCLAKECKTRRRQKLSKRTIVTTVARLR